MPFLGEPEEAGALQVAAMRPHALANQLDESEVFTSGDAEPAVVLGAREPNDGDDVATVALHTTASLPASHLAVTATSYSRGAKETCRRRRSRFFARVSAWYSASSFLARQGTRSRTAAATKTSTP